MCKLSNIDTFPSAAFSFSPSSLTIEVFVALMPLSNGDLPLPSSLVLNFRPYSCFCVGPQNIAQACRPGILHYM